MTSISREQDVKSKKVISAGSGDATVVKASKGRLHGIQMTNTNAAVRYLKLHNVSTAPTAGTTAVEMVIALPPNVPVNIWFEQPIVFSAGISYTLVTTAPDSGSTGVAANELTGSIFYL